MENDTLLPLTVIQEMLKDRKLVYISKQINMSHPTIKRVADGEVYISRTTHKKISDYLRASALPAMQN